jgi:hypothetical protein
MTALYGTESEKFTYQAWLNTWRVVFPFVKIRVYKQVTGKCWCCYWITDIRKRSEDRRVHEACKQLFMIHRSGLFMPERREYKKRIEESILSEDDTLSLIIDGMDQNHCKLPQQAQKNQFPDQLTQHITGCLVHGNDNNRRVTLYRNMEHLSKGSNLTIHIIYTEIQKWRSAHRGRYPTYINLQMDGGPENANKYVLAALEYLVSLKYVKRIKFSRLPAGHTHEDIDAVFGVIWNWFKGKIVDTPDEYKQGIEDAFKYSVLKIKVEDIYVIADYMNFFKNSIIDVLARLHKKNQTQHQWRFECVEKCQYFPNGCKTTFRAYCNDRVVEIEKRPISKCLSSLGKLTGLEAITTYSRWSPTSRCIEGRPIEGLYILKSFIKKLPFTSVAAASVAVTT